MPLQQAAIIPLLSSVTFQNIIRNLDILPPLPTFPPIPIITPRRPLRRRVRNSALTIQSDPLSAPYKTAATTSGSSRPWISTICARGSGRTVWTRSTERGLEHCVILAKDYSCGVASKVLRACMRVHGDVRSTIVVVRVFVVAHFGMWTSRISHSGCDICSRARCSGKGLDTV
ncbi:hypothetical protein EJ03DRAFT_176186 [Teratosphaeria nubilosa]|uniref:Uncharacterized protein n=1 Tax=Teratosphaeria nubilosa TaxID=161662 RepID=A0A6G1L2Y0_9PEZI|nr:hypothetical protein EJ03DRAFT_176186 [Teratosphaeria nubilosa]